MFDGMHTVTQGSVGVGVAIADFVRRGWVVSIPLNDNQKYDLIVDKGEGPKTVQVKTTQYKKYSSYVVQLKRTHHNRSKNVTRHFVPAAVDFVYVLCADGTTYLIPTSQITSTTDLTLSDRYNEYKTIPQNPSMVHGPDC